jgi:hypothetical protein
MACKSAVLSSFRDIPELYCLVRASCNQDSSIRTEGDTRYNAEVSLHGLNDHAFRWVPDACYSVASPGSKVISGRTESKCEDGAVSAGQFQTRLLDGRRKTG